MAMQTTNQSRTIHAEEADACRVTAPIELDLIVLDPEVCAELEAFSDVRARNDFAVDALKIGVVALRQVRGRIDVDRLRSEGDHLLDTLKAALDDHQEVVAREFSTGLKEYFDPTSGRLAERIERLVKRDGELEQVLRRHVGSDSSELARTLITHLGDGSPFAGVLDPSAPDGLLGTLTRRLNEELSTQRERIIGEFSLDNANSALSRLVTELSERHGELGQALEGRIDEVVAEFSLDREDSALSRLVGRVEQAQRAISQEFSLDQEQSALARIRRELLSVIDTQRDASERFHREVLEKLATMTARRQEAARSTRHGDDFESQVFEVLQTRSQNAGDVATRVGNTTGIIKNCKVGDAVIALGPEHAAAGTRISVEAKEREGFDLADALALMEKARKNRQAEMGLFVFSARTAPEGLEPFARYGDDVVVVWDADDARTDVVMIAGLSVARALCTRAKAQRDEQAVDFSAIDTAIREIERQIVGLDEIATLTGTIQTNSAKVIKRTSLMRASLEQQVDVLDGRVRDLQTLLGGDRK
jgi:gas vesicle protein